MSAGVASITEGITFGADALSTRSKITRRANAIMSEYEANWRPHHQDIMEHVRPRRGRWVGDLPNKGDKKNAKIINSAGSEANRVTQAGLHGGLTSPNWPWFKLGAQGIDEQDLFGDAKKWLYSVEQQMYRVFGASNLYRILPSVYSELTAVGTAAMTVDSHPLRSIHCTQHSIGTYGLANAPDGSVNTIVREFWRTVGQLEKQFGIDSLTDASKQAWNNSQLDQWVKVRHVVEPNDTRIPARKDFRGMPFRSVWWEQEAEEGQWLREKGFEEFPTMVPRWESTEEDAYGSDCPGMMGIGHIRQLQVMERRKAEALLLMLQPPLDVPAGMRANPVSLAPRAVNYTDVGSSGNARIQPILQFVPPIEAVMADIERLIGSINRTFFADLFITIIQGQRDPQKTATEIAAIQGEKLLMLGPVIERVFDDLLQPLIARTYGIMDRMGMIPPPPPELAQRRISVEFISTLAQAQRAVGLVSIERFVGFVGNLAGVRPDVLDVPNWDKLTEEYASLLNVNPNLITEQEDRDAVRQAQAQAAQNAQMAETGKTGAEAAKLLSETEVTDESALGRLIGTQGGLPGVSQ